MLKRQTVRDCSALRWLRGDSATLREAGRCGVIDDEPRDTGSMGRITRSDGPPVRRVKGTPSATAPASESEPSEMQRAMTRTVAGAVDVVPRLEHRQQAIE